VILVFDVGNTETTIGLFDGRTLAAHWRVMTDAARTPDEIGLELSGLLRARDVALSSVTGARGSSTSTMSRAPGCRRAAVWIVASDRAARSAGSTNP